MAEFPAIPLWTDAYLSDTRHLTTEEHGAYLLLIMEAWRRPDCTLPDDDTLLSRLSGLSAARWGDVKPVVMAFWKRDGRSKTWSQKRLSLEKGYVSMRSKSNKEKAAKRWSGKTKSDATALPRQCPDDAPTPTPTPTPIKDKREATASPKTKGSRLSPDWQLPSDWAAWATAEGLPSPPSEADRFRDYWIATPGAKGVKADWLATWRNWVRKAILDLATSRRPSAQIKNEFQADPKDGDEKLGLDGAVLKWVAPRHRWERVG